MKTKKLEKQFQGVTPGSKPSGATGPVVQPARTNKLPAGAGMHTRDACSTAANKQDACATSAKPRKRRVLVVDEFDSVRRGIYWELKQTADLECCGEAGSVDEALALLPTLQPDIVVLDLVFKNGKHGLSLLRELRLQKSTLPVLVFTGFGDLAYYALVRCAGARGVVCKEQDQGIRALIPALRAVLAGQIVMPAVWLNWMLHRPPSREPLPLLSPAEVLTAREMEVFEMVGAGLDVKEIALLCDFDVKTAEQHLRSVRCKLHQPNHAALVRAALRWVEHSTSLTPSKTDSGLPRWLGESKSVPSLAGV